MTESGLESYHTTRFKRMVEVLEIDQKNVFDIFHLILRDPSRFKQDDKFLLIWKKKNSIDENFRTLNNTLNKCKYITDRIHEDERSQILREWTSYKSHLIHLLHTRNTVTQPVQDQTTNSHHVDTQEGESAPRTLSDNTIRQVQERLNNENVDDIQPPINPGVFTGVFASEQHDPHDTPVPPQSLQQPSLPPKSKEENKRILQKLALETYEHYLYLEKESTLIKAKMDFLQSEQDAFKQKLVHLMNAINA